MDDAPRDIRRLVRQLLALALLAGSASVGVAGVLGVVPLPWGIGLALAGAAVAATLPGGGRAAGWLFAIWCAATLIMLGREAGAGDGAEPERVRLAIIGGVAYLALASAGFWACGSIAPRRGD